MIEVEYLTRQKLRPSQIVRSVRARCGKAGIPDPGETTIRRSLRRIDRQAVSRLREPDPRTQPVCGETPIPDYPLDVILVDPVERRPISPAMADCRDRHPQPYHCRHPLVGERRQRNAGAQELRHEPQADRLPGLAGQASRRGLTRNLGYTPAGVGIPVEDLRALLPSAIWNRLTAEIKALMETEEGRQKFDSMFSRSA